MHSASDPTLQVDRYFDVQNEALVTPQTRKASPLATVTVCHETNNTSLSRLASDGARILPSHECPHCCYKQRDRQVVCVSIPGWLELQLLQAQVGQQELCRLRRDRADNPALH